MAAAVPPEADLLLACVRGAALGNPASEPAPRHLRPDDLLELAERHRLIPLLHRHLAGPGSTPPALRAALSARAGASARRSLALAGELRALAETLARVGIRVAAYKGPALAVRAYGDVALRSCSDLDLLVAPEDMDAAGAVLRAAGYLPYHALPAHAVRLFRRVDGDEPWHDPRRGTLVELHCRVSSLRFGVDLDVRGILERGGPVPVGGAAVLAPADGDHLLALALHGAKHRWARLEWLASFGALLARGRITPAALLQRARTLGAGREVLLGLHLLHEALGVDVTAGPRDAAAADAVVRRLAAETAALWFAGEPAGEGATVANLVYNFRLRQGAVERVRYGGRWLLIPSPEDFRWLRLPAALAPLHRVLRPIRLAVRYGPGRRG